MSLPSAESGWTNWKCARLGDRVQRIDDPELEFEVGDLRVRHPRAQPGIHRIDLARDLVPIDRGRLVEVELRELQGEGEVVGQG